MYCAVSILKCLLMQSIWLSANYSSRAVCPPQSSLRRSFHIYPLPLHPSKYLRYQTRENLLLHLIPQFQPQSLTGQDYFQYILNFIDQSSLKYPQAGKLLQFHQGDQPIYQISPVAIFSFSDQFTVIRCSITPCYNPLDQIFVNKNYTFVFKSIIFRHSVVSLLYNILDHTCQAFQKCFIIVLAVLFNPQISNLFL